MKMRNTAITGSGKWEGKEHQTITPQQSSCFQTTSLLKIRARNYQKNQPSRNYYILHQLVWAWAIKLKLDSTFNKNILPPFVYPFGFLLHHSLSYVYTTKYEETKSAAKISIHKGGGESRKGRPSPAA